MSREKKKIRQNLLTEYMKSKPFYTDEEIAKHLGVSIQTIRLDRLELGIPELRERVKKLAQSTQKKVRSISSNEVVGELLELELGKSGISLLNVTEDMVFEKTKVARGEHMFSQANSLALALIDSPVVLTGVANVKYKVPVHMGDKLIAKAKLKHRRGNKYFVKVSIKNITEEVFRAKFILVSLDDNGGPKDENCN